MDFAWHRKLSKSKELSKIKLQYSGKSPTHINAMYCNSFLMLRFRVWFKDTAVG